MQEIQVDEDVFAELQRRATPLVDSANSVLRRLLDMEESSSIADSVERSDLDATEGGGRKATSGKGERGKRLRARRTYKRSARAPKGTLLGEEEYELPILDALLELDGRGAASEVLTALEPRLAPRLKPMDLEPIESGSVRWKSRAQFARLRLVRRGDMSSNSPRGIWEITEQGRHRVQEQERGK